MLAAARVPDNRACMDSPLGAPGDLGGSLGQAMLEGAQFCNVHARPVHLYNGEASSELGYFANAATAQSMQYK